MPSRGTREPPALVDLHVHSSCSADGASSIADYAQRAAELGLSAVGFCEHVDLDPRDQDYGYLVLSRYDQEIAAARVLTEHLGFDAVVNCIFVFQKSWKYN